MIGGGNKGLWWFHAVNFLCIVPVAVVPRPVISVLRRLQAVQATAAKRNFQRRRNHCWIL